MAQRSPARYSTTRRVDAHPVDAHRHRRARRSVRGAASACIFLILAGFGARAYVLHIYAPGLRTEARTIPALVQRQVAENGGSYLSLASMSPDLQHAIVAIEDRRFYNHSGVDPQSILRAVWVNLRDQHVDQGGSTLEEQLAKRVIVQKTDSLHDKLRTMVLAWAIDQEFDKRRILEFYLNDAYYGQGATGASAAARIYFGTDAAHLTTPQAAFLAAMPQAPSIYGAHPRSSAVLDRTRTVLQDMRELGYISTQLERRAEATPLTFALPNP